MAVMARDEVTLTRVDVDETTQWHFWHDGEGAHVSERERPAEGEPVEGKNLLLSGDVIQLRDGEEVLASFSADAVGLLAGARSVGQQAAVEMFGGDAWIIGRDDEPNEGQVRRSLYVGADLPEGGDGSYSSVALTPFRPGEGYPGIGNPGVFIEQHGPIPADRRMDNTTIRLNAATLWLGYNDASLSGASFPMTRLMSVLNNAPYVTSDVPLGSSDACLRAWVSAGVVTVDYLRAEPGFWTGNPGQYTRLGTVPEGLRPRADLRQHAVSKDGAVVYMYVGADGAVGFVNVGTAGASVDWFFGCSVCYAPR